MFRNLRKDILFDFYSVIKHIEKPMRKIIIGSYIFLGLFLLSCKSNSDQKTASSQGSAVEKISLPAPGEITAAEKARLHNACQLWYDTMLARTSFNGGMVVAKKGNIIFEKYKGSNPLGSKDSVNENTAFHIASVSKTITATCVLKLWQDSLLNIDDQFSKYFPEFNYPGVTIRSMLNHRSGLPNYVHFIDKVGWKDSTHISNRNVLNILIQKKNELENIGTPNTRFSYCNSNYALLALLIEKVTGKSYPDYVQQHIFTPLGMNNSFVYTAASSAKASKNYDWRGKENQNTNLDDIYGDKNIYSTPRDLLTWDRALSADLICNKQIMEQAYTPYSNEKPGVKNYGLGWRMNIYPNGKKVIFHNGWWHGNNAAFIRLIDQDATIIVLGNRYNRNIYKAYQLINSFGNYFETLEIEE
ncbi:MAG: serine hydrolase domain-containing protein [Ferruginibacter sp.]